MRIIMRCLLVLVLLITFTCVAWSQQQQTVFEKIKTRFSKGPDDRRLVDKDAVLILDDAGRKLIVRNEDKPLSVGYDDIQKVVFDVSTHMRGGALGTLVGGVAGAAISAKHVNDYWCYVEYKGADGTTMPYMLEINKDSSARAIEKMKAVLGDKVTVTEFTEQAKDIEKNTLKDLQSKHDMEPDEKNHPMPEIKQDKALVVVVCPTLAARYQGKGNQFKFHANDQVIAVNKMGTYSFAYLDPGDYVLVSQTENASGFPMKLEAGKDYYFLQNTFMGTWKAHTTLSRQSKELVMYELNGAYYSNWKRKE